MDPSKDAENGDGGGEIKENPVIETENGSPKQESTEDHSSPRGVLEIPVVSGSDSDSVSSDSRSNSFSSSSSTEKLIKNPSTNFIPDINGLQWKSFVDVFKMKSVKRFSSSIPMLTSSDIMKLKLSRKLARFRSNEEQIEEFGLPEVAKPSWRNFDLAELEAATDNFSPDRLIGKGGHAEVYKGKLSDGKVVAVKRLMKKGNDELTQEERTVDFLSELGIIAHINHPNAARLLGFGVEGGLHLVLEYLQHGSLASFIHGTEEDSLKWKIRYKVALGIAEGLNYLHVGCHRRIIHRDIKASNILLTKDYKPQISDFGLAKWLPENWTHHIVFPIEGTFGYLAPEYFMHGIVDEKTDVFAYGVLLLELLTGRLAVDSSRQSLVMWAKPLLELNNMKELVDPRLGDAYNIDQMKLVMSTASMCIHHLSTMRPSMSLVVQLLKGEKGSNSSASCSDAEMLMMMMMKGGIGNEGKQQNKHNSKPSIMDGCDLDDYSCSTYLHDLNRHRELALLE